MFERRSGSTSGWIDREAASCLRSHKGACHAWSQQEPDSVLTSVACCQALPCFCLDSADTWLDTHGWLGISSQGMAGGWCSSVPLGSHRTDFNHWLCVIERGPVYVSHQCPQRTAHTLLFHATLGALSPYENDWCLAWVTRKALQRREPGPGRHKLLSDLHWMPLVLSYMRTSPPSHLPALRT